MEFGPSSECKSNAYLWSETCSLLCDAEPAVEFQYPAGPQGQLSLSNNADFVLFALDH